MVFMSCNNLAVYYLFLSFNKYLTTHGSTKPPYQHSYTRSSSILFSCTII